jgi:hypothetical protein
MELEIVSEFIHLNKSKWQLTDKLCTLPLFKMSYIALDAFSARLTLFFLKDPVLWNIVPKCNNFSDEFLLLNENQKGFRKKYSTLDNTFVIHGLFELLKIKKRNFSEHVTCNRLNMGKHLKQNRYKQFLILYYYTGLKLHCTIYPLYYT